MKDYKQIIKENESDFNDSDALLDFVNSYTNESDTDVTGLDDDINEYADGQVPIYYGDIVKEWAENSDAHGLTVEQIGEYDGKGDIYKMMQQDLFFYYQQQLSEDYNKLIEIITE